MGNKWKQFVKICKQEKADLVGIAGDICPKQDGILSQVNFMPHLKKYAQAINEFSKLTLMLGNDDNQLLIPEMEKEHGNLWHYAPDNVMELNGHEIIGMPFVPDYPFGYKFWCAPEFKDDFRIQPCYNPVLINANNEFEQIPSMTKYFDTKTTMWDCLKNTATKVKNIEKSIWMIHAPPSDCDLDVCASGYKVGSRAILKFIEEYQPLITIHGHIHESPEYTNLTWFKKVIGTMCIQGGQMGFDVHYVVIEVEDGKIMNMRHSIYGEAVL